jgi:hypothetical protein
MLNDEQIGHMDGQTERHDKANSHFFKFCKLPQKQNNKIYKCVYTKKIWHLQQTSLGNFIIPGVLTRSSLIHVEQNTCRILIK